MHLRLLLGVFALARACFQLIVHTLRVFSSLSPSNQLSGRIGVSLASWTIFMQLHLKNKKNKKNLCLFPRFPRNDILTVCPLTSRRHLLQKNKKTKTTTKQQQQTNKSFTLFHLPYCSIRKVVVKTFRLFF